MSRRRRFLLKTLTAFALTATAGGFVTLTGSSPATRICEPDEIPLFMCETNRKDKFIGICAVEKVPGHAWSSVQYRFGPSERAELVYPADGREGASKLLFSHVRRGPNYEASIRFTSGGFEYLIESFADETSNPPVGAAGISVTGPGGKNVSDIDCIERPTMYAAYLQMALACDLENPLGKAACAANPPVIKKR